MAYQNGMNAYRKTEVSTVTDPNKLIQMLYDGALLFLEKARVGTEKGDHKIKGENLSRALDIITELNACLDIDKGGETAEFLRSIYLNMLMELPKVNLNNDTEAIVRSSNYIRELKKLWEERVMGLGEPGTDKNKKVSKKDNGEGKKSFSVAI